MKKIEKELNEIKESLLQIKKLSERYLKNTNMDNIKVSGTKKYPKYYLIKQGTNGKLENGTYISSTNTQLIKALCQKKYIQRIKKETENQINALEKFQNRYHENYIEEIYEKMPAGYKKHITTIVLSDEDYAKKWLEEQVGGQNPLRIEKDYYSEKGEHVRSRIELIIANKLTYLGIPYVYEPKLELGNGKVIYPDFKLLNKRTRKEYYWEHLGMMDNPIYLESSLAKLEEYHKNNILVGKKLIITMESQENQINVKSIDKYIKEYLY